MVGRHPRRLALEPGIAPGIDLGLGCWGPPSAAFHPAPHAWGRQCAHRGGQRERQDRDPVTGFRRQRHRRHADHQPDSCRDRTGKMSPGTTAGVGDAEEDKAPAQRDPDEPRLSRSEPTCETPRRKHEATRGGRCCREGGCRPHEWGCHWPGWRTTSDRSRQHATGQRSQSSATCRQGCHCQPTAAPALAAWASLAALSVFSHEKPSRPKCPWAAVRR